MSIEAELKDIKRMLTEILRKFDELLEEKEITAMTKLSEISLREFLENEPDIYSIKDCNAFEKFDCWRNREVGDAIREEINKKLCEILKI